MAARILEAAMRTLRCEGVGFRGPLITPNVQDMYPVDSCILTASERIVLHHNGSLGAQPFSKLLTDLRHSQSRAGSKQQRGAGLGQKLRLFSVQPVMLVNAPETTHSQLTVTTPEGPLACAFRIAVRENLALINAETRKEQTDRVLRAQGVAPGHLPPFEFEEPSLGFWPVVFLRLIGREPRKQSERARSSPTDMPSVLSEPGRMQTARSLWRKV